MTIKQALAGILAHTLFKLQSWTRGRCGGFRLYHHLWMAYTEGYTIQRTGYIVQDWRAQREAT